MVYICGKLKKNNMNLDKKIIASGLLTIISYTLTSLAYIWAIVEFIIYLVKDKEFNWWSVIAFLILTIASVAFNFMASVYTHMSNKQIADKPLYPKTEKKYSSRFEQRMAEAKREAEERRSN